MTKINLLPIVISKVLSPQQKNKMEIVIDHNQYNIEIQLFTLIVVLSGYNS